MSDQHLFTQGKKAPPTKTHAISLASPHRHFKELRRARGRKGEKPLELNIPSNENLESELKEALEGYTDPLKKTRDRLAMEKLKSNLLVLINDYKLAAGPLDQPRKSWIATIIGGLLEFIVLVLDFILFTFTFTVVLIVVTEKFRPAPEITYLATIAAIFAVAAAAGVKLLAFYASNYPLARSIYIFPWLLFASADFYYFSKQGNGNIGLALTAFLMLLCAASYYTAKHASENPWKRKELVDKYNVAQSAFQKSCLRWQECYDQMMEDPTVEINAEGITLVKAVKDPQNAPESVPNTP